ncbi:hypothetical protein SS50377_28010 [Spironucleus salmonicida]|uniref:Transmembrane protein n=1 Tax=Spironucleus salmonicida TaxID=348837 RepID=A0A9P8RUY8_9EUKA|nr:hypothetical protein SS50377_28010 [Spironucleus salmonicida]
MIIFWFDMDIEMGILVIQVLHQILMNLKDNFLGQHTQIMVLINKIGQDQILLETFLILTIALFIQNFITLYYQWRFDYVLMYMMEKVLQIMAIQFLLYQILKVASIKIQFIHFLMNFFNCSVCSLELQSQMQNYTYYLQNQTQFLEKFILQFCYTYYFLQMLKRDLICKPCMNFCL